MVNLKMSKKKIEDVAQQQCCVNCCRSFNAVKDEDRKEEIINEITIDYKFPITSWSIESVLSSLFNLHHLEKLPAYLLEDETEEGQIKKKKKKSNDKNQFVCCPNCAMVLCNLYRSYVEFNRLSKSSSYLATKIQQLDKIMTMFQSTWSEMSQLQQLDNNEEDEGSFGDDACSLIMDFPNSPSSTIQNFHNDDNDKHTHSPVKSVTPVNPLLSTITNDDDDEKDFEGKRTKTRNLRKRTTATSNENTKSNIILNEGPWVKIRRLADEEIFKAVNYGRIESDELSLPPSPLIDDESFEETTVQSHKDEDSDFVPDVDDISDDDYVPDMTKDPLALPSTKNQKRKREDVQQEEEEFTECPRCNRLFRCERNLTAHSKICHGPNPHYKMKGPRPKRRSKAEMIEWLKQQKEKKLTQRKMGVGVFKCSLCPEELKFPRVCDLVGHWKTSHTFQKYEDNEEEEHDNFDCPVCRKEDKTFLASNSSQFKSHLRTHVIQQFLTCPHCQKIFDRLKMLKSHMRYCNSDGHYDDTNGPCNVCGKTFKRRNLLLQHRRTHIEKTVPCTNCHHKYFRDEKDLQMHMKTCLGPRVGPKAQLQCPHCDKTYATPASLNLHIRSHTGKGALTCPHCNKVYYRQSQFNAHCASHGPNEDRPHKCPTCGKGYLLRKYLTDHMRSHTGERPFLCPVCGGAYRSRQVLKVHMMGHATERRLKCRFCPATFKRPDARRIHEKSHDRQTNCFICHICPATFITSNLLKNHLNTHPEDEGEKNPKLTCSYCKKGFATSGNLMSHVRARHTKERPFVCTVPGCSRSFTVNNYLSRHMKTHEDPEWRPYRCKICGIGFTNSNYRKKHELTHNEGTEVIPGKGEQKIKRNEVSSDEEEEEDDDLSLIGDEEAESLQSSAD